MEIGVGFHLCEFCHKATSSGDVRLLFNNGHFYQMPDMLVHYVQAHNYRPPQEFIDDVMSGELLVVDTSRQLPLSGQMSRIGYLSGDIPQGDIPPLFMYALAGMMAIASQQGGRLQTRGM